MRNVRESFADFICLFIIIVPPSMVSPYLFENVADLSSAYPSRG